MVWEQVLPRLNGLAERNYYRPADGASPLAIIPPI